MGVWLGVGSWLTGVGWGGAGLGALGCSCTTMAAPRSAPNSGSSVEPAWPRVPSEGGGERWWMHVSEQENKTNTETTSKVILRWSRTSTVSAHAKSHTASESVRHLMQQCDVFTLQITCQLFSRMHWHWFSILSVTQARMIAVFSRGTDEDALERSLPVSCSWLHMELSAGSGWRGRQVFLGSDSSKPWPSGMEAFCTNSTNSYKTNGLIVLRQPTTKPVNYSAVNHSTVDQLAWCANNTLPQAWNQVHQKAWSRPWEVYEKQTTPVECLLKLESSAPKRHIMGI